MGQAKQRGTYEERVKKAEKRKHENHVKELAQHNMIPKHTKEMHFLTSNPKDKPKPFYAIGKWEDSMQRYQIEMDISKNIDTAISMSRSWALMKSLTKSSRLHLEKNLIKKPTEAVVGYNNDEDFLAVCRADKMTDREWQEIVDQAKTTYYRTSSDNRSVRQKIIDLCKENRATTKTFKIANTDIPYADSSVVEPDVADRVVDFCDEVYKKKQLSAHEIFTSLWEGFNGLVQAMGISTSLVNRGHTEFDDISKNHMSKCITIKPEKATTN